MRKENLENLTHIEHMEGKRSSSKQQVTYLTSLQEWMTKNRQIGLVKDL